MSKEIYEIENLDCANCSAKIESEIAALPEVNAVHLNFVTKQLSIEYKHTLDNAIGRLNQIASGIEPGVVLNRKSDGKSARKFSIKWYIIIFGMTLLGLSWILPFTARYLHIIQTLAYLAVAHQVLITSGKKLLKAAFLDEHFLMTIATLGALYLGEIPEAIAVMFLYELGQVLEARAVNKSRRMISSVIAQRPEKVRVKQDGEELEIPVSQAKKGDLMLVFPGERIALDGIIENGTSEVDTSSLTGEAEPMPVGHGDEVFAGFLNRSGMISIRVERPEAESAISRILNMIESAAGRKSRSEKFITRFARIYTPVVVVLALLLFLIPVLWGNPVSVWLPRALIFLIVSCPCALVISIPLSYYIGIGIAARRGIIFKGGVFIDILRSVKTMVFDKTGTLTTGALKVRAVQAVDQSSEEEVFEIAYNCEYASSHPIAKALKSRFKGSFDSASVEAFTEVPGNGIVMKYNGDTLSCGSDRFFGQLGYLLPENPAAVTRINIAKNELYLGSIELEDEIKTGMKEALAALRKTGVQEMLLLSGDRLAKAEATSKELALDGHRAELLPEQKLSAMEEIIGKGAAAVAYVGDGLNDAPVLALADVGIAMGEIGNQASIETADIVLLNDKPSQLVQARLISQQTYRIVWQNVVLALGIKFVVMGLGAVGLSTLWEAVIADVGVTLLAILNSMRAMKIKSAA